MFLVNGQESHALSLPDRAIHYGDGLFETLAVKNGQALCWQAHIHRLIEGCKKLRIECPDMGILRKEAEGLCADIDKGILKLIISRGEGGRGYTPPATTSPTRILATYDWPDYPDNIAIDGVETGLCQARLGHNPMLAGLKHLNRLEQVLLRAEAVAAGRWEGIVLDIDGNVIEGTMSNLFILKENRLITADLGRCGVAGVIREIILARANDWQLVAEVSEIKPDDLFAADEVFLCNSVIGIWPVRSIDKHVLQPGKRTKQIREQLCHDSVIIES